MILGVPSVPIWFSKLLHGLHTGINFGKLARTNEASYFDVAHASFERALSPFALLAVTT